MDRGEQEYGRRNPNAPGNCPDSSSLSGQWRCEARLKREDGVCETLQATWVARYVLEKVDFILVLISVFGQFPTRRPASLFSFLSYRANFPHRQDGYFFIATETLR